MPIEATEDDRGRFENKLCGDVGMELAPDTDGIQSPAKRLFPLSLSSFSLLAASKPPAAARKGFVARSRGMIPGVALAMSSRSRRSPSFLLTFS